MTFAKNTIRKNALRQLNQSQLKIKLAINAANHKKGALIPKNL